MRLEFADLETARAILGTRDEFIRALSPFDRRVRMKSERDPSEAEFLEFVAAQARAWKEEERARMAAAWAELRPRLEALHLPLPDEVLLIRTTGDEEAGAAYTRGNSIICTPQQLGGSTDVLARLLGHELFHVFTRANPAARDALYASIGFESCGPVELPPGWRERKITNPDAPVIEHALQVRLDGRPSWVMPMLYARKPYVVSEGGGIFAYLVFKLLVIDRGEDGQSIPQLTAGGSPRLVEVEAVEGYFEQIGRNTGYIIHPEEILAENFVLLVLGRATPPVPNPEIVEKMRALLAEFARN